VIPARELVATQKAVDPVVLSLKDDLRDTLPADRLDAVEIAVTEALTNIGRHAQTEAEPAQVRILVSVTGAGVTIEIADTAPPGPADLFERARSLDEIDPLEECGRGLALIRFYSDGLSFEPGAAGNRLKLEFTRAISP
jgi:serine/threonine-protein kinase RsbW